ncbi:MAG: hypothetical protein ACK5AZ_01385 [Bryobacteraceae bacterium]
MFLFVLILLFTGIAPAAPEAADEPVGVVLAAGDSAQVLRWNHRQPAPLRTGELIYPGDRLRAGGQELTLLYCPKSAARTYDAGSEAVAEPARVVLDKGQARSERKVSSCFLPKVLRLDYASLQRFGGMAVRDMPGSVRLLTPVNSAVRSGRPSFSWRPVDGADSYDIEVSTERGERLWKARIEGATEAAYSADAPELVPGRSYRWRVQAFEGERRVASAETRFRTLSEPERARLETDLARIESEAGLAAGIFRAACLERAGVLHDAISAYDDLIAAAPNASWLKGKRALLAKRVDSQQRPPAI